MMMTMGEMKGLVLNLLNRTPDDPGFYTDAKLEDAINEAMDDVAFEIMMADDGWLKEVDTYDVPDSATHVKLHSDTVMIKQIRYKQGNTYYPLVYDTKNNLYVPSSDSGVTNFPISFSLLESSIYFNPPVAQGGTDYLQVESIKYPKRPGSDFDTLPVSFDRSMFQYVKYAAASSCRMMHEQGIAPWLPRERHWRKNMVQIIAKRNNQPTTIREFEG